ncbi:MAG: MFS transporter [Chloroflexi bacterium]|nr:MFS transporter [Chloroflexota bacterium]
MSVETAGEITTGPPRYRWVVTTLWMTGHTWSFVILGSLGFLLPSMREELGLSPIEEGLLGSAPQVANVLLAIPFGLLLTRFRPKLISSISFFAAAALIFFQGWAPFFLLLLLGRLLYGAASSAREPARVLLIRQWMPPNEIVIANSLANFLWGIVALGFIATPLLLELLDNSWRNTLHVFGAISLVMAVAWHLFGRERITPEYEAQLRGQGASSLRVIFRYKEVWFLALGMFGVGVNWSAFSTFWPSFRLDEYGMSLTASATVMAVGGAFSSVGGLAVGILVSRIGRKRQVLLLSGVIIAATSPALLWISSYPVLFIVFMVQSLGWSFFPIIMTIPFELPKIRPREVAVVTASVYTVVWMGAFVGPILAGAVQEVSGSLRVGLLVTSLAPSTLIIAGLLLPRAWDRAPTSSQTETGVPGARGA